MVGIKNNRRAQYTQSLIQDTVLSLLEQNPINNITVTQVCKIADINRTTFYRYYDDIYQCVDQIEIEFLESIEAPSDYTPVQGLQVLLEAFNANKKLSNLVFVEGKTKILEKMHQSAVPEGKTLSEEDTFQETYIMLGLQGILKKWVKDGMKQDPAELTRLIIKIVFAEDLQKLRTQLEN